MSEPPENFEIKDPITKRNYYLIFNYLMYLLDSGLNYLKREYIDHYEDDNFIKKISAPAFFEMVLRDNIRTKVKYQLRAILRAAVACLEFFDGKDIKTDELEKLLDKKYPMYAKNDMTLLHTTESHPAHQDLRIVSRLTFRMVVVQCTRLMAVRDPNVKIYEDLVRGVFKNIDDARKSVIAILSTVDQMIDIFESNLDLVSIPVYKPTFSLRDFIYVRKIYEYAQGVIEDILQRTYREGQGSQ